MTGGHRISLIIPCLNEAEGLRAMLPHVPSWVDEVVVVDNGSTDSSPEVARTHGARVVEETRRGYGWACLRGLREATAEIIVKLDGDGTYPLEAVEPLVRALLEDDLGFVSGCRFPLKDPRAMSWTSYVGNQVLTAAANWRCRLRLLDSLSGMWAVRRQAAGQLRLGEGGIPFSQEIKVEAFYLLGQGAREVHIPYRRRIGTSKLMPLRDGAGCLKFLLGWRPRPRP